MTETNWGENEPLPPKKKTIPTWLWFCGGGCLLALIVAIVAGTWLVSQVKDSLDPEKQWPKVAEILPFDQRPPDLELTFGMSIPLDWFMFIDEEHGLVAMLFRFGESDAREARDQLMNPEFKGGFMSAGAREDLEAGHVTVQGRELSVLRFHQNAPGQRSGGSADRPEPTAGQSIMIELTQPGSVRPVILQIIRGAGDEPISDEEVRRFLEPFHVGSER